MCNGQICRAFGHSGKTGGAFDRAGLLPRYKIPGQGITSQRRASPRMWQSSEFISRSHPVGNHCGTSREVYGESSTL